MKRSLNAQSVSRHSCARMASVCAAAQYTAQKLYALRYFFFAFFFVFFFTPSPI